MAKATDRVVLWHMAGGLGARPSSVAVVQEKDAPQQREEGMLVPLFVPPQDR